MTGFVAISPDFLFAVIKGKCQLFRVLVSLSSLIFGQLTRRGALTFVDTAWQG
jgi:hypothetical protein